MVFYRKNPLVLFIYFFIIAFIIYLLYLWKHQQYKGRGYCNINNEYIYPEQYSNFIDYDDCQNIIKTATPNLYKVDWLMANKSRNEYVMFRRYCARNY